MTFTYNADVSTDRDKVRLAVFDTVENEGPLPTGTNFTDAEIDAFLDQESSWQRAVARALETLANAWATSVTFKADGVTVTRTDVVREYRQLARDWRRRYGGMWRGGSSAVLRKDGFSDDIASDET